MKLVKQVNATTAVPWFNHRSLVAKSTQSYTQLSAVTWETVCRNGVQFHGSPGEFGCAKIFCWEISGGGLVAETRFAFRSRAQESLLAGDAGRDRSIIEYVYNRDRVPIEHKVLIDTRRNSLSHLYATRLPYPGCTSFMQYVHHDALTFPLLLVAAAKRVEQIIRALSIYPFALQVILGGSEIENY